MSESKKTPLCWQCRWVLIIFSIAVFVMLCVIFCTGKPESGLENWITVLIFLVTISAGAVPLLFDYKFNSNKRDCENLIKDKFDEIQTSINGFKKDLKKFQNDIQKNYEYIGDLFLNAGYLCLKNYENDKSIKNFCNYILYFMCAVNCLIKSQNRYITLLVLREHVDYIYKFNEKNLNDWLLIVSDIKNIWNNGSKRFYFDKLALSNLIGLQCSEYRRFIKLYENLFESEEYLEHLKKEID